MNTYSINIHQNKCFFQVVRTNTTFIIYVTLVNRFEGKNVNALPPQYQIFKNGFWRKESQQLLQHQPHDCYIELQGVQPPFGPIYIFLKTNWPNCKVTSMKIFWKTSYGIENHLQARWYSLWRSNWIFHMCVDYHGLNKITIKNHNPLFLILRFLSQNWSSKNIHKIDLKGAYNLISIKEGDEWKTIFHTTIGHFYTMSHILVLWMPLQFFNTWWTTYLDNSFVILSSSTW